MKREERIKELSERIDNLRRWIREDRDQIKRLEAGLPQLESALTCFEIQRTQIANGKEE